MREDAFRAYLAPLLGRRSVDSYVSDARRVERELRLDLDKCDLADPPMRAAMASALRQAGYPGGSVNASMVAVRRYAEMRDGTLPRTAGKVPPRPTEARHSIRERSSILIDATVPELMRLYGDLLAELRDRGISRSGNGPVGDYGEHLFAEAYGWTLAKNAESGHDAVDQAGRRYQIKARRLGRQGAARQLGAIRRLADRAFDTLAAVLFDDEMTIARAVLIPHEIVAARASFVSHTNSWRLMLPDRVWALPGVVDATDTLRAAAR